MENIPADPGSSQKPIDLSFFARHKKSIWGIVISAAVITAALLAYVIFFRNNDSGPDYIGDVRLEVEAPTTSPTGSEISYKIIVKNLSNIKLTELDLEIFYPSGFSFLDATPDPPPGENAGRKFRLADLMPRQEQSVVIVGALEGSLQEIKIISAKLYYVPENFRSAFVVESSAKTEILAPDLAFRLIAPPHLVSGQSIQYQLQINNISSRPFSGVLARIQYPEKFIFLSAEPPPTSGDHEWTVENIAVGEQVMIKINGRLDESPGRESFVSSELLVKNAAGDMSSAGRSFAFVEVLNSPLKISHRLEKASATVLPGENLSYVVEYENISQIAQNNVVLTLVFETPTVDFTKVNSAFGQYQNQSIVWIPAQAAELIIVDPGEKGEFELRIPVSEKLVSNLQKNPLVKSRVQFRSKELPVEIAGNTLEYKIQSVLEAQAKATALGNDLYRIDLSVKNGVNDVVDAVLTAVIPRADAQFLPETITPVDEQGNVKFVPDAGLLRWDLGRVFAFTGSFHEARTLSFQLRVPQGFFLGQAPPLLKDIQITGTDEFTGEKIESKKIDSLTTR